MPEAAVADARVSAKADPAGSSGPHAAAATYHAHIYFDDEDGRVRAERLCEALLSGFGALRGMARDERGGPHPTPMRQMEFGLAAFGRLVPWLMLNREDLDVLVHPVTGDARADHGRHALWLGRVLNIDFTAL